MSIWLKEKRQDLAIKIILFSLSPFFALLYSLRTIKTKSTYLVFFLTAAFFGLSFTVESGKDDGGLDSQYYRNSFESYLGTNYYTFKESLANYLTFDTSKKDFYFDTISFYTSRVTDSYHAVFAVAAIIFAFFSLKSLKFLTREPNYNSSISNYILTYLFLYNQIFNINGLRFWTAAWIGVYCIFQIFRNGNKRYYLLVLLTPFFHGSFTIFIVVLLFAELLKSFNKTWSIIYFISFLLSKFAFEFIQYFSNSFSQYLPAFIQKYSNSYADPNNLADGWSGFGWLGVAFDNISSIYLALIIFLFIKSSEDILSNKKSKALYQFLLVWMSVFNFLSAIPSLGSRYMIISYPVIAYIWLVNFKGRKHQRILYILPIVFLWDIYIQLLRYKEVLDPLFYFSSPFYLYYKHIIAF